jgi:hypothetical protein
MLRKASLIGLSIGICVAVLLLQLMAQQSENEGLTVKVSVQASDSHPLHYQWRSTDGVIQNVNAPTTTWTLPPGPGLHFAYVLVYNSLGGYTERRLAVNTDSISGEIEEEDDGWNGTLYAPPGPAQVGDYYRSRAADTFSSAAFTDVYLPNVSVFLTDLHTGLRYPRTGSILTDQKGEYVIPGVPGSGTGGALQPHTNDVAVTCELFGVSSDCTEDSTMLGVATSYYLDSGPSQSLVVGTFTLQDGSPCGTFNEFFGVHSTATATLLDASNKPLVGPVQVNEFGDYALPPNATGTTVSLACEGASPVQVPFSNGTVTPLPTASVAGVTPPTVTNMTATLNGKALSAPVAIFLPPPSNLPSDVDPRADNYLAEKGLDSRLGACKYYQAVGAVKGCGPNGELLGATNYQDWQKAVKIGKYAKVGVPTFKASYINKVDLNLARVHQSITYGPNQTAAVVCNHLGPPDFFNPSQAEIDTAVENAVANKNLVACVAMDYSISPGVNNNQPFIRFLIFGPSGQLLPSINLDGRREKFVPGTCVVCHGGDHYAGKFPEDGSGFANVGGHFLPYDAGNFEFASKPGLQKCDQEEALFNLNRNVLNAGPTGAEQDLIAGNPGWYTPSAASTCPSSVKHVLNENFVPPSWASQDATSVSFYQTVIARSCRTCHVAMIEGFNFDHNANVTISGGTDQLPGGSFDFEVTACGVSSSDTNPQRWYTMPNSLVTFNRFWLSYLNTIGIPDQATSLINFANDTGNGGFCIPQPPL